MSGVNNRGEMLKWGLGLTVSIVMLLVSAWGAGQERTDTQQNAEIKVIEQRLERINAKLDMLLEERGLKYQERQ